MSGRKKPRTKMGGAESVKDVGDGRYREQYGVIVICRDERHQRAVYELLHTAGMACKVVCT